MDEAGGPGEVWTMTKQDQKELHMQLQLGNRFEALKMMS